MFITNGERKRRAAAEHNLNYGKPKQEPERKNPESARQRKRLANLLAINNYFSGTDANLRYIEE